MQIRHRYHIKGMTQPALKETTTKASCPRPPRDWRRLCRGELISTRNQKTQPRRGMYQHDLQTRPHAGSVVMKHAVKAVGQVIIVDFQAQSCSSGVLPCAESQTESHSCRILSEIGGTAAESTLAGTRHVRVGTRLGSL